MNAIITKKKRNFNYSMKIQIIQLLEISNHSTRQVHEVTIRKQYIELITPSIYACGYKEVLHQLTSRVTPPVVSSTKPITASESSILPSGDIPKPTQPVVSTRTAQKTLVPFTVQYSSYSGDWLSKKKLRYLAERLGSWANEEQSKKVNSTNVGNMVSS